MRSSLHRARRGFILGETLMAFMIALWLVPLTVSCISVLAGNERCDQQLMDETAALQLRRIFLFAYDVRTDGDTVYYRAQNRDMTLSLVNRNVIIQPGTQIIFAGVDSAYFRADGKVLKIIYERDDRISEKTAAILP